MRGNVITEQQPHQTKTNESPLDFPIHVTIFGDRRAVTMKKGTMSLRALAKGLPGMAATTKDQMRHIKLSRFSGERTGRGSYRHNAGQLAVSGIEGDYDAGEMSVDDAEDALASADVAAMIYTTPSHQKDGKGHRWRVLCPLRNEAAPSDREALVARVNGALGGFLSGESFTASQSYAFGVAKGGAELDVRLVDGRFLDECADLDAGAAGKHRRDRGEAVEDQSAGGDHDIAKLRDALSYVPNNEPYEDWLEILMAIHAATGGSNHGRALAHGWCAGDPRYKPGEVDSKWRSFGETGGSKITADTLFFRARQNGWNVVTAGEFEIVDDIDLSTLSESTASENAVPGFLESAAGLEGLDVPPREWMVPDLIPHRTVTILGGDGGTGKSLLALQLAVASATRQDWIGQTVERPGRVVYISAEDERDELHRRMAAITEDNGLQFSDLSGLMFRSLAGEDAILGELDRRSGKLKATKLFKTLEAAVIVSTPSLVVLDTLADLHSGDQNDQGHARQFVNLLRGLCVRHGCTVLLLAHPSLTGINTGTGTGGSMAWGNSVRSRLYLRRVKESGQEIDPDSRVLETMKSNYGKIGGQIGLRWRAGVFGAVSSKDESEMQTKAENVFMKLLAKMEEQGRKVSHKPGCNYAPKIFADHPEAEGMTKRALKIAMDSLLDDGGAAIEKDGPPSKRRQYLVGGSNGFARV
jgi:RecA-family ATPase